jgi:hypothetical protein
MSAVEKALAALEQAGEPVADWRSFKRGPYVVYDPDDETYLAVGGAWHLDLDDGDSFAIFEDAQRAADDAGLGKVESYWVHQCPDLIHDAYQQFTLQRLGQEFDAGEGEPVAYMYTKKGYFANWSPGVIKGLTDKGWTETSLYAHPPQSRVAADPVGLRDDEGKLVATARRNIRTFISAASFNSENDRQAAIACIDVLEDHMNGLGDLVAVLRSAFDAASSLATPAQPDPQSRGQAFDGEGKARELLAQAYEEQIGEGPYPSYARLAREGSGDFTLCSIRAIQRALSSAKRGEEG